MSDCRADFDLTGAIKLVKALDKMGKSPQKAVTKAASKAITPVKRAIKNGTVPVGKTGTLKRAITRKAEKSRFRGKKIYVVTFDRKYNTVLQKPIDRPGIYGGKSPKAYYPASQEYGFLTRKKGGEGMEYRYGRSFHKCSDDLGAWYERFRDDESRSFKIVRETRHRIMGVESVQGIENRKVEGQRYMRKGAEASEDQAKRIMVETMEKELDKLWKEATHA